MYDEKALKEAFDAGLKLGQQVAFRSEAKALCILEKTDDLRALEAANVQLRALSEQLRTHMDAALDSMGVVLTDEGIEDKGHPIDEVYARDEDVTSFEALMRWVELERLRLKSEGAIFDTGFRCVSEGGTLFYFDPEGIVDLLYDFCHYFERRERGAVPPEEQRESLRDFVENVLRTQPSASDES